MSMNCTSGQTKKTSAAKHRGKITQGRTAPGPSSLFSCLSYYTWAEQAVYCNIRPAPVVNLKTDNIMSVYLEVSRKLYAYHTS